jgi:dTDP-4-dehydrorhamnose reductase
MRIAVTGKSGQVVSALLERGPLVGHEVVALGRPELDLADPGSVTRELTSVAPDVVVSAAAYTAVDKAESQSDAAYTVNSIGAKAVANAAKALNVPMVQISTDYVFNGEMGRPYDETDATGPTGVYGASKLAGEHAVLEAYPENCAVLRVAWVYSPFGGNFVKTMLRLAADRDEISVVDDQIGNPTNALDIADGILKVSQNLTTSTSSALRGVFHMTASGDATWADFAEAIFAESIKNGGPSASVNRITAAQYPTPAKRPNNSRLDCTKIKKAHGVILPDWEGSLETMMRRLQTT